MMAAATDGAISIRRTSLRAEIRWNKINLMVSADIIPGVRIGIGASLEHRCAYASFHVMNRVLLDLI